MTTLKFLAYLRSSDIRLWVDGGKLRYSAPAGALTPELRAELIKQKADILALLSNDSITSPPIRTAVRERNLPLSFAQLRLWILNQMEPGSSTYNISKKYRLTGPLNVAALGKSINEIVRRHESLRTTITILDDGPVQVIAPTLPLSLQIVDLRCLSEPEQQSQLLQFITKEERWSFDLTQGPLLRTSLLRISAEEHIFIITMHHIISDGWSIGILNKELSELYTAFSKGEPSPLAELPIQYADYAIWQRAWLKGETLNRHLVYWKKQLDGIPAFLDLPADYPRPSVQTYRGAHRPLRIPKIVCQSLKDLSRQAGVTLFMILVAAFQTLLHRYTQQDDIVVGCPVANRNRLEIEELIGFFVNTLVLRTDFSGNPSFMELLGRVREVTQGAYEHQDLPFEKLVEELQPERDPSRNPLFQVSLNMINLEGQQLELPGLTTEPIARIDPDSKFDLSIDIWQDANGLSGFIEFNTDLFDTATIDRLAGHFQTLLDGIVKFPQQRISDLPLLTAAEQQQLQVEWNDTRKEFPQDKCIHQLFEAQVERTPEAAAVVLEDKCMTYRELNQRANQLAVYLQDLGVGPDGLVGICMERSLEMVVALLGTLKAGGAYVPLDPAYPTERLGFMLEDTQAPVLLTQQRLLSHLPQHGAQAVCLDKDWDQIALRPTDTPIERAAADNLAYVIYTSGSTGKPKGVMIEHRSLVNLTEAAVSTYDITSEDRILQFASICFDLSAEEIYTCLTCGATLVLRTDSMLSSMREFLKKSREWAVTVWNPPTAYWHELTSKLGPENLSLPPSLRLVILGGEKASADKLALWQQYAESGVRLINGYGPTEATVTATIFELSGSATPDPMLREIPIGHAIQNVKTYILDRYLQAVPIGVAGELHIGGAGLARGYLNRPELTAEKFIDNPFNEDPAARLYKTGDLVRYLPDGNIEFLGRIDHQVKIRGFRIELGEIEAVLGQHPAVQQNVVVAGEDASGDKRLVAYLVLRQETSPLINELRRFLKQKLPEYMVPAAFVFAEALPLTPNGKVDRQALPPPDQARLEVEETFVLPRTPVEETLVEIWCEVLGITKVGIYDNFFNLGGHSLMATRLISRLRNALQVNLTLKSIFEAPTVVDLASHIETLRSGAQNLEVTPKDMGDDRLEITL